MMPRASKYEVLLTSEKGGTGGFMLEQNKPLLGANHLRGWIADGTEDVSW